MSLAVGSSLGAYEIQSAIGAGGMGEVYRAKDTKLGREVAVKILPATFTSDPERVARFRREAQVLASLNHPNIAQIYDLEEANGTQFLVLELVDGESLDRRIARGRVPVDEALGIGKQIAEALEAAHEKGIIHRDLKPANVALTHDEHVKVLDFGLAKAVETTGASSLEVTNSPTITSPAMMTGIGVVLGTAAYMAPEQAKGKPADKRSDIWAFGCVLYEMLAGRRAFDGDDVSDAFAAVLRAEPDWSAAPSGLPSHIQTLFRRCLVKDPRQRLQAIGEARIAIETYLAHPDATQPAAQTARTRAAWLWPASAAASLLIAFGVLGWAGLRPRGSGDVVRFEIHAPDGSTLPLGTPAFSPDGRTLAYTVTEPDHIPRLHVRSLDGLQSRVLPATDGAVHPLWSTDGRSLAFVSISDNRPRLRRFDLMSGAVHTLTEVSGPWHGTWNRDGTILFTSRNSINEISGDGGSAKVAVVPDEKRNELTVGFPFFMSDGKRFLTRVSYSDDHGSIELATLGSPDRRVIISDSRSAPIIARTPGGKSYLLYMRESDLLAQEFDETSGTVLGHGIVVVNNIGRVANPDDLPTVGASSTGILAYQVDTGATGELVWFDRSGHRARELPTVAVGESPALSPHGQFAAVQKRTARASDIWLTDLVRGSGTRLTFSDGFASAPVWSPDGERIAYHVRSSHPGIYEIPVNGNGQERLMTSGDAYPLSWSRDGKYLLYRMISGQGGPRLFLLSLTGDKQSIPVTSANGVSASGAISPDGRSIAFSSTESGRSEIYVESVPSVTGKRAISVNGGSWPRWRSDGKELFFLSLDWKMMAADVDPNTTVVGIPHELFRTPLSFVSVRNSTAFDVSADGREFLMYSTGQRANTPITVVLNWMEELKQRVPTR